jgi:tetratricopeptide (TPR) repeat protein
LAPHLVNLHLLTTTTRCLLKTLFASAIFACLALPGYSQPSSLTEPERADRAIPLNNQGKALREEGQLEQSRALLEQACSLDPNHISAIVHENLAITLERLGNLDSAKAQYLVSLQFAPNLTKVLYNLAVCCAEMGKVDESSSFLREYLTKEPDGKFSENARRLLGSFQTVSRISDDPKAPDYFAGATGQTIARWPVERPIRVFIEPGEGVFGYQPSFNQILLDAFFQWIHCTNCLSLQTVSSKEDADIVCHWISDRKDFQNSSGAEGGKTNYHWVTDPNHIGQYLISNVDIALCTVGLDGKTPVTEVQAKSLCLHEIGHALGLKGHSSNNNDVMFFAQNYYRPTTGLSDRDKATIIRLYAI